MPTVLGVSITKSLPVLELIFYREICLTGEKWTCSGASELSPSRKEDQVRWSDGLRRGWYCRAGLSQGGDVWAETWMTCRAEPLCHLKKEHRKHREQHMKRLWIRSTVVAWGVWKGGQCDEGRMDKPESGRRRGQREKLRCCGEAFILFWDREPLEESEHTSDMSWKFWKDYSRFCGGQTLAS